MIKGPPDDSLDNFEVDDYLSIPNFAEISFLNRSLNCCVCFVDMVNSTKITAELYGHRKIRQYYSIFINAMAALAKNYNAKIIKNAGDALIFYFPEASDSGNGAVFKDVLECFNRMILAHDLINAKMHSENLPSVSYRIVQVMVGWNLLAQQVPKERICLVLL